MLFRSERLNIPGCLEMLDLRRWAHTAPKLAHIRITHLRDILGQMANEDLVQFLDAGECPVQFTSTWPAIYEEKG